MRVFFDTSAFVKRYIGEAGTEAVLQWSDQVTEIILSAVALPEMVSAFCRLQREGRITEAQYKLLKSSLLADIEDAAVCVLTPVVYPVFACCAFFSDPNSAPLKRNRAGCACHQ